MTQRTFGLTLLLIIAVITTALPWLDSSLFNQRDETILPKPTDPESLLASGHPLPLSCADLSSLELLPGISDKTGTELLEKRDSIIRAERFTSLEESFQLARGVGSKTAARLVRYLSANGDCDYAERYYLLTPESG
jgi:DNA uptake protein ComE-like DNA-binding protein